MDSIIVNPKDEKELKFVSELLEKLGVNSKVLSVEEKEDLGLSFLMAKADRVEEVPRDEIYKSIKDPVDDKSEFGLTDEEYEILDERRARHLAGESGSYSWQEVKDTAKKMLK